MSWRGARRSGKYNVKPVVLPDGTRYGSPMELQHHRDLRLEQHAGRITELKHQVEFTFPINGAPVKQRSGRYPNGRVVKYIADFTFQRHGELVVQDTKGFYTALSKLKIALMEAVHGIRVEIVRFS